MSEAALIQSLRTSTEAKRILDRNFDFLVTPPNTESSLFQLRDGIAYEVIATDASGGMFALCEARSPSARPLLYASSEGQAGIIARSLEHGLSIIIELPYWQDCLKFSKGGQLVEMRRVIPLAESDLVARRPQIATNREAVRRLLGLSMISDVVASLHSALTDLSQLYPVCSSDGWPFESLFGKFTVMSNGEWRRRLNQS